uniref:Uncharacterized protein n=1 Tax=Knipowitschia caucasica TaxID=637954 RepID=A0AAV2KSU6_KNICA
MLQFLRLDERRQNASPAGPADPSEPNPTAHASQPPGRGIEGETEEANSPGKSIVNSGVSQANRNGPHKQLQGDQTMGSLRPAPYRQEMEHIFDG